MSSLLSIHHLSIGFDTESGLAPGVEDICCDVRLGEIVALVGESGSGKSITALSILRLLPAPPARVLAGEIRFTRRDGQVVDLLRESMGVMQQIRGGEIG